MGPWVPGGVVGGGEVSKMALLTRAKHDLVLLQVSFFFLIEASHPTASPGCVFHSITTWGDFGIFKKGHKLKV
jgi:hypothetical protein